MGRAGYDESLLSVLDTEYAPFDDGACREEEIERSYLSRLLASVSQGGLSAEAVEAVLTSPYYRNALREGEHEDLVTAIVEQVAGEKLLELAFKENAGLDNGGFFRDVFLSLGVYSNMSDYLVGDTEWQEVDVYGNISTKTQIHMLAEPNGHMTLCGRPNDRRLSRQLRGAFASRLARCKACANHPALQVNGSARVPKLIAVAKERGGKEQFFSGQQAIVIELKASLLKEAKTSLLTPGWEDFESFAYPLRVAATERAARAAAFHAAKMDPREQLQTLLTVDDPTRGRHLEQLVIEQLKEEVERHYPSTEQPIFEDAEDMVQCALAFMDDGLKHGERTRRRIEMAARIVGRHFPMAVSTFFERYYDEMAIAYHVAFVVWRKQGLL